MFVSYWEGKGLRYKKFYQTSKNKNNKIETQEAVGQIGQYCQRYK
jgi:hypothetical protein